MSIRASCLVTITLVFLVGCSNSQSSGNTPSNSPTDQTAPDHNSTNQDIPQKLAPIPEMVQNVVNSVHQKIENGEIDLGKENNLNMGEINITTTGSPSSLGDMIYVQNVNTKDLITIRWVRSANGYELVGYSFPSHGIKFNCPGPCPMYYPQ